MKLKFIGFLLFVVAFLSLPNEGLTQDRHFSQFYSAPIYLSPALTGAYEGNFRVGLNYRDQWRRTLDNPFTTSSGYVDLRLKSPFNTARNDYFAVGVLFFTDKVPAVDFNTNQIGFSAAFHKALDVKSSQYLSFGLQLGLNSRNINFEKLRFADQFDGITGYSFPTNEVYPINNFAFGDLSTGIHYSNRLRTGLSIYGGVAMHHLLEPTISFEQTGIALDQLNRKYTIYGGAEYLLREGISVIPRVFAMLQGKHAEYTVGSNVRLAPNDYSGYSFYLGGWLRSVQDTDTPFRPDAVVILTGIEFNNILFGLSYDVNLGNFTTNQWGRQALEFSIGYLGEHETNDGVICPKF